MTGVPVGGPDRDSAVDIAYTTGSVARHVAWGPEAPKSVTDNATRCPKRSAQLRHGGAERSGLTWDAVVYDDVGARDKLEKPAPVVIVARIQDGAAFVRVVQCERNRGARQARPHEAGRAATRWFDLQHVGAQVGEKTADRLTDAGRHVEHPHLGEWEVESRHGVRVMQRDWVTLLV